MKMMWIVEVKDVIIFKCLPPAKGKVETISCEYRITKPNVKNIITALIIIMHTTLYRNQKTKLYIISATASPCQENKYFHFENFLLLIQYRKFLGKKKITFALEKGKTFNIVISPLVMQCFRNCYFYDNAVQMGVFWVYSTIRDFSFNYLPWLFRVSFFFSRPIHIIPRK